MNTIRDGIERRVNGSPYLRDAITKGLINMSSLARQMQPEIQKELRKPVSTASVIMALKRFAEDLEAAAVPGLVETEHLSDLSLRAELVQWTVANSERLMPIIGEILTRIRGDQSSYLVFSRGAYETSIVVNVGLRKIAESWLSNERITHTQDNLSALSLRRVQPTRQTPQGPGVLHVPMQVLAWQGIEVVDVISTTNELTLILLDDDVDQALTALRPLLRKGQ